MSVLVARLQARMPALPAFDKLTTFRLEELKDEF